MRITWTMALRSRMNHRYSLRYSGSFPKCAPPFLDAEGPVSACPKFPLSPCSVPHTLNQTAPATVTPATNQQVSMPYTNEKEPSAFPPRKNPSHGHGAIVNNPRNLAAAPIAFGIKNAPTKNNTREASHITPHSPSTHPPS